MHRTLGRMPASIIKTFLSSHKLKTDGSSKSDKQQGENDKSTNKTQVAYSKRSVSATLPEQISVCVVFLHDYIPRDGQKVCFSSC